MTADNVEIQVTNYGLGIPLGDIESIRQWGFRSRQHDRRAEGWGVTREGGGIGLPTAIAIIEDHRGSLDVDSVPADDSPRGPDEEFHRYHTRVTITMPTDRRRLEEEHHRDG